MDGAGIRAALDQGALAAQLGTAFLLCPESTIGPGYRQVLAAGDGSQTRLTSALSGRPARGMVNRFIAFAESHPAILPPDYPVAYDAAKQLIAAGAKVGRDDVGAFWAGQGAPLVRELPAADLVAILVQELAGRR